MPIASARRDLSNDSVYGVAWVPWHGAQQIFARPSPASWAQRGQISTLGRSDSLAGATRCTPATPDHFATISSGCGGARARSAVVTSSALLMVASRSRQRATPRHVGARLAVRFALQSPQRTPAPSPRFSCAWVLPPEAQQAQRDPAVARRPPRGFAAPAASASARLARWKGNQR